MKKTWSILSDILNRKAINPLPDMMTIQGHECSDKKLLLNSSIYFLPQWECRMYIEIMHTIGIVFETT